MLPIYSTVMIYKELSVGSHVDIKLGSPEPMVECGLESGKRVM